MCKSYGSFLKKNKDRIFIFRVNYPLIKVEAKVELMAIPLDSWMKTPINVTGACVFV